MNKKAGGLCIASSMGTHTHTHTNRERETKRERDRARWQISTTPRRKGECMYYTAACTYLRGVYDAFQVFRIQRLPPENLLHRVGVRYGEVHNASGQLCVLYPGGRLLGQLHARPIIRCTKLFYARRANQNERDDGMVTATRVYIYINLCAPNIHSGMIAALSCSSRADHVAWYSSTSITFDTIYTCASARVWTEAGSPKTYQLLRTK